MAGAHRATPTNLKEEERNVKQPQYRHQVDYGVLPGECITLTVGITGYVGFGRLGAALENVAGTQTTSIVGLGIMNEAQMAVERADRTLLLPGLELKAAEETRKQLAGQAQQLQSLVGRFRLA